MPIPHARGGYVEKVAVRIASRALLSQGFPMGRCHKRRRSARRGSLSAGGHAVAAIAWSRAYTRASMGMKSGSETLEATLYARVDELIRSHKGRQLLSTTGSRGSIEELAARVEGLEQAIREIARDVQKVAAAQRP